MFEHFWVAAPQMDADIKYDEFKQTFVNWRESTTASPSGRHLGHYRSLLVLDGTIDEEGIGEQMMLIHYQVTMCAVATGVPLEQWQTCVSCHIKKYPGSPKLHRLWIIHIYEADLSLVLKLLWSQKLIRHAEQHLSWEKINAGLGPAGMPFMWCFTNLSLM